MARNYVNSKLKAGESRAYSGRKLLSLLLWLALASAAAAVILPYNSLFVLAVIFLSAYSCICIWSFSDRRSPLNIPRLSAWAVSYGYGIGTLVTIVTAPERFYGNSLIEKYAVAFFLVVVAVCFLHLSSSYSSQLRLGPDINRGGDFWAAIFFSLLILYAYLDGSYLAGGARQEAGRVSIVGTLAAAVSPVVPFLFFNVLVNSRIILIRRISVVLLALSVANVLPLGRRQVLAFLIIFVIYFYRMRGHASLAKFSLVMVTGFLSAMAVSTIFTLSIRLATSENTPENSIAAQWQAANSLLAAGGAADVQDYLNYQNRDRGFILRFLSDLVDASFFRSPMYGAEIIESFKRSIPRQLGVKKFDGADIENISQDWYGLPRADEANSVLTTGAADFGFVGVIFLPFVVAVILQKIVSITSASSIFSDTAKSILLVLFVFRSANIEDGFDEHFFCLIRNGYLLMLMADLFCKMVNIILRGRLAAGGSAMIR